MHTASSIRFSNGTRGKDQPVTEYLTSGRAIALKLESKPGEKPATKYVIFETVEEQLAFALDVLGQVPLNVINSDERARKYAALVLADNLLKQGVNIKLEHVRQDQERK